MRCSQRRRFRMDGDVTDPRNDHTSPDTSRVSQPPTQQGFYTQNILCATGRPSGTSQPPATSHGSIDEPSLQGHDEVGYPQSRAETDINAEARRRILLQADGATSSNSPGYGYSLNQGEQYFPQQATQDHQRSYQSYQASHRQPYPPSCPRPCPASHRQPYPPHYTQADPPPQADPHYPSHPATHFYANPAGPTHHLSRLQTFAPASRRASSQEHYGFDAHASAQSHPFSRGRREAGLANTAGNMSVSAAAKSQIPMNGGGRSEIAFGGSFGGDGGRQEGMNSMPPAQYRYSEAGRAIAAMQGYNDSSVPLEPGRYRGEESEFNPVPARGISKRKRTGTDTESASNKKSKQVKLLKKTFEDYARHILAKPHLRGFSAEEARAMGTLADPLTVENDDVEEVRRNSEGWIRSLINAFDAPLLAMVPAEYRAELLPWWTVWQKNAFVSTMNVLVNEDKPDMTEACATNFFNVVLEIHHPGSGPRKIGTSKTDQKSKCSKRLRDAISAISDLAIIRLDVANGQRLHEFAAHPTHFRAGKVINWNGNYGKKAECAHLKGKVDPAEQPSPTSIAAQAPGLKAVSAPQEQAMGEDLPGVYDSIDGGEAAGDREETATGDQKAQQDDSAGDYQDEALFTEL